MTDPRQLEATVADVDRRLARMDPSSRAYEEWSRVRDERAERLAEACEATDVADCRVESCPRTCWSVYNQAGLCDEHLAHAINPTLERSHTT